MISNVKFTPLFRAHSFSKNQISRRFHYLKHNINFMVLFYGIAGTVGRVKCECPKYKYDHAMRSIESIFAIFFNKINWSSLSRSHIC